MEYRTLGTSDVTVSLAGLGCNNFGMLIDEEATRRVVDAAIDAGITFFDTAQTYGGGKSEEFLGRAIGDRRADVVIASKFGAESNVEGNGGSAAYVQKAIDTTLTRLGTDYVDLFQLHFPDKNTPIAETLGALDELVKAGKVLAIGNSNMTADQLREADRAAVGASFVTAQNEWSLLNRDVEAEVIPACRELGLSMLPYFPLLSGLLTGKYSRGDDYGDDTRLGKMDYFAGVATDENFDKVDKVRQWADDNNRDMAQVAISWLAGYDVVGSVIAGATKPEQARSNAAAGAAPLNATERDELSKLVS